jgi:hypothetical protein
VHLSNRAPVAETIALSTLAVGETVAVSVLPVAETVAVSVLLALVVGLHAHNRLMLLWHENTQGCDGTQSQHAMRVVRLSLCVNASKCCAPAMHTRWSRRRTVALNSSLASASSRIAPSSTLYTMYQFLRWLDAMWLDMCTPM